MQDIIAYVRESLAEVLVPGPGGMVKSGTAFAIESSGLFGTCEHVIRDAPRCALGLGRATVSATVVSKDEHLDLAILRADVAVRALPLGSVDDVAVGVDVLWGGFPLDSWLPSWHRGMVSYIGPLPPDDLRRGLQVDGTVNRGNSGGPILEPKTCTVVAIVSSRMGALSEKLATDLRKLQVVSGDGGGPAAGIRMTVGSVSVDPNAVMIETIQSLAQSMQLGVGYGISAEHLAKLRPTRG